MDWLAQHMFKVAAARCMPKRKVSEFPQVLQMLKLSTCKVFNMLSLFTWTLDVPPFLGRDRQEPQPSLTSKVQANTKSSLSGVFPRFSMLKLKVASGVPD